MSEQVTYHAEIESTVARMVRQLRERDDERTKVVLRAFFEAGAAWSLYGEPDFDEFLAEFLRCSTPSGEDDDKEKR